MSTEADEKQIQNFIERLRADGYDDQRIQLFEHSWRMGRRSHAVKILRKPAICGATRGNGLPCPGTPEPGRRRCKFHGGRTNGPTTKEGRERIAEAQRERWRRYREHKAREAAMFE